MIPEQRLAKRNGLRKVKVAVETDIALLILPLAVTAERIASGFRDIWMCSLNGDTMTSAPSAKPMRIELVQRGDALALEVVEQPATMTPAPTSLDQRIMAALADAVRPLPFAKLRARCRVRAATLYQRIAALAAEGRISKTDDGYRLAG